MRRHLQRARVRVLRVLRAGAPALLRRTNPREHARRPAGRQPQPPAPPGLWRASAALRTVVSVEEARVLGLQREQVLLAAQRPAVDLGQHVVQLAVKVAHHLGHRPRFTFVPPALLAAARRFATRGGPQ